MAPASTRACRSRSPDRDTRHRGRRPSDLPAGTGRVAAGHRRRRHSSARPPAPRRYPTSCVTFILTSYCSTSISPMAPAWKLNRWLAREQPDIKVIVLTMSEDHHAAVSAIRDGARGYLVKGADPSRVEHALRTVMAGDVVLDHDIAGVITGLTQLRSSQSSAFPQLSPREFDILELVARRPRQQLDCTRTRTCGEDCPEQRLECPRQDQRDGPSPGDRARPPARHRD